MTCPLDTLSFMKIVFGAPSLDVPWILERQTYNIERCEESNLSTYTTSFSRNVCLHIAYHEQAARLWWRNS